MEVAGLVAIGSPAQSFAQSFENFGEMGMTQIANNIMPILLLGVMRGITRFIAAWGIWSMKKWAVCLGCAVSIVSLIAAISIIPAGAADSLLAAPVLSVVITVSAITRYEHERSRY